MGEAYNKLFDVLVHVNCQVPDCSCDPAMIERKLDAMLNARWELARIVLKAKDHDHPKAKFILNRLFRYLPLDAMDESERITYAQLKSLKLLPF